jgi:hypothetical protein
VSNQHHPSGDAGPMGAIEIKTTLFPLAFLLYLFPAKITIDDGAEIAHGWGTRLYPIAPGRHRVRAWCPYMFGFQIGDLTMDIDVYPGQVTGLRWACPWLVFLPGRWDLLGVRTAGAGELAGATPAPHSHAQLQPTSPPAAWPQPAPQAQPQRQPQPQPVPAAASAAPAGWHPDPRGQAALRWWDGRQWTEHVHNG